MKSISKKQRRAAMMQLTKTTDWYTVPNSSALKQYLLNIEEIDPDLAECLCRLVDLSYEVGVVDGYYNGCVYPIHDPNWNDD